MPSALHRIDPQLLTIPHFYGSPGEPTLGRLPNTQMPMQQAQGMGMGPLMAILAGGGLGAMSGNAQAPGILAGMGRNPYDPIQSRMGPLEQLMFQLHQPGRSDFVGNAAAESRNGPLVSRINDPNHEQPLTQDQLGYMAKNAQAITNDAIKQDTPVDVMSSDLGFNKAFAMARKMGLEEFTWRGKPFTTKLKE